MKYMVVIYYSDSKFEDYEYFNNKKEGVEYAKYMKDNNTKTSVWEFNEENNIYEGVEFYE